MNVADPRPGRADSVGPERLAPYRSARVLVVGGSGFVGRHVVAALARAGVKALQWTARDRAWVAPQALGVSTGQGTVVDLRDDADVRTVVADFAPSIVFNLAGYGVDPHERDEDEAELLNDRLVGVLARTVAGHRQKQWRGLALVHAGSALEYGSARGDLNEGTTAEPTTLYGRTKLAGTNRLAALAEELALPATTARMFMLYGPGEHEQRLLPSLVRTARTKRPLELTEGKQERDFTYVEDAAAALLLLGLADRASRTSSPGEVVNVATGRLTSVRQFVERAAELLAVPRELLRFGALPTRTEEMSHDPVAIARLKERVGWTPPTGIDEGLRKALAGR